MSEPARPGPDDPLRIGLAGGVAFTTGQDIDVDRRAAAEVAAGHPGLTTVAVSIRRGRFLVCYRSGRAVEHTGTAFAAELADLPLYGADLRLWLIWPTSHTEQKTLDSNLRELADTTGATVWTPPAGGEVEILAGCRDLAIRDERGEPGRWWGYRPAGVTVAPPFASDVDGRLVPVTGPELPAAINPRWHGVCGLPAQPPANTQPLLLHVRSPWPPERVAREGFPSPDLFLYGEPVPDVHNGGSGHPLRLRVAPGGAVRVRDLPAPLRPETLGDPYLLPAGWLDRARLDFDGSRLMLRCTGARHGTDGLPDDAVRWPAEGYDAVLYAFVPQPAEDLATLWLAEPPVYRRRRLVRLVVPAGAAIDVQASAALVAGLASVRSRLPDLVAGGARLILPPASFDRAIVTALFTPAGRRWRARRTREAPLSAVIPAGRRR
jgi:hypothetical protein